LLVTFAEKAAEILPITREIAGIAIPANIADKVPPQSKILFPKLRLEKYFENEIYYSF